MLATRVTIWKFLFTRRKYGNTWRQFAPVFLDSRGYNQGTQLFVSVDVMFSHCSLRIITETFHECNITSILKNLYSDYSYAVNKMYGTGMYMLLNSFGDLGYIWHGNLSEVKWRNRHLTSSKIQNVTSSPVKRVLEETQVEKGRTDEKIKVWSKKRGLTESETRQTYVSYLQRDVPASSARSLHSVAQRMHGFV
jgi:hypothetical protein